MKQKKLIKYLRLSMEDGDVVSKDDKVESDSISHQRYLLNNYITRAQLDTKYEVMELVDDGYSGTDFNRPAMKRLLTMVKKNDVAGIIVKDISRFGRNYLEVGDYLEQIFPFLGIRFIAINDHYDSDDYRGVTGGLDIAFQSLVYDLYSRDLSKKIRSSLMIRRRRGDYIGPYQPFGYVFCDNRKKLKIDLETSKYVQMIFRLALEGKNTGEIAKVLNASKIPTPAEYKVMRGQRKKPENATMKAYWKAATVRTILQNQVYLGKIVNGKSRVKEVGSACFESIPPQERIYVSHMHDYLVTPEVFEQAQRVIKHRETRGKRKSGFLKEKLLKGKLVCGHCCKALQSRDNKNTAFFNCLTGYYTDSIECKNMQLEKQAIETTIEELVRQQIVLHIGHGHSLKEDLFDFYAEEKNGKETLERIFLDKRILYEKYKEGKINREVYLEKIELLRKKQEKLVSREEQRMGLPAERENKSDIALTRELIDLLIDKILVYDSRTIDIQWKYSFTVQSD